MTASSTWPLVVPGLAYDQETYRHYLPDYGPFGASVMLLYDNEHEAWRLTRLYVHQSLREQRHATEILTAVTSWADAGNHRLILFADAMGHDGPTTTRLIRWYKEHGFEHIPNKHQSVMLRPPKGQPP